MVRLTLGTQGAFYVLTGVWPLVSLHTFELVTGPKTDDWLVRTVGVLAIAIGASLLTAARTRRGGPAVWVLAIGAALAFAGIDIVYVSAGRIRPVYLLDAAAESLFAVALGLALWRSRQSP